MPPRLDPSGTTERLQLVAPPGWIDIVDRWRARQTPVMNRSEAIRTLVEMGLEAAKGSRSRGSRLDSRR